MKYVESAICLAGIALLAYWLLKTSLGRRALADSAPRRNNMPFYLAPILFCFSFGAVSSVAWIAGELTRDLPDWQSAVVDNIISCVGAAVTVIVIIVLARAHFARRLRGFGLSARNLPRDLVAAPLYLLAACPLIMLAVKLTIDVAEYASNSEYQMQQHQQLKVVTEHPQLVLRILVVAGAVVVGPLFEELLFRGLVQTTVRSFLSETGHRVWLAIVLSSVLFVTMHQDRSHWPALFILGLCMGYAYEKSGSLWRPIFIHAIFNATAVISTLNQ